MTVQDQIKSLCAEKNAIILCHTYQPAEIQDIADYVGDSYGLSKKATEVDADIIVFCGVRFMAETAAVLNPERRVFMPDASAGCPMADMISGDQLRELKQQHPGAPVVCYVNSTAEVKAESTICCTSSNAVEIVESLDADEILFVPDQYLGMFVQRRTGRNLYLWEGYCPTHAKMLPELVEDAKKAHPNAEVMVHPECTPQVQDLADHVISTGQMCELVKHTTCTEFIVGTELGIVHTLQKIAPHITFTHLHPALVCPNMKKTTLEKVRDCLVNAGPVVTVPPEVAEGSRQAIQAMLNVVED